MSDPAQEIMLDLFRLNTEIQKLERLAEQLENKADSIRLIAVADFIQENPDAFYESVDEAIEAGDLVVGYHVCDYKDNPGYFCIYDESQDPSHDDCIFCGNPEERK